MLSPLRIEASGNSFHSAVELHCRFGAGRSRLLRKIRGWFGRMAKAGSHDQGRQDRVFRRLSGIDFRRGGFFRGGNLSRIAELRCIPAQEIFPRLCSTQLFSTRVALPRRPNSGCLASFGPCPRRCDTRHPQRMWTPPVVQAGFQTSCGMRSRYGRMSGLSMQHSFAAGPYGVRGSDPNRFHGLEALRQVLVFPTPSSMTFCPYVVCRPHRPGRDHPQIRPSGPCLQHPVFRSGK